MTDITFFNSKDNQFFNVYDDQWFPQDNWYQVSKPVETWTRRSEPTAGIWSRLAEIDEDWEAETVEYPVRYGR